MNFRHLLGCDTIGFSLDMTETVSDESDCRKLSVNSFVSSHVSSKVKTWAEHSIKSFLKGEV